MKKSKRITFLIVLIVIVLMITLFLIGNRKIALAPIDTVDTSMPLLDNKNQILGNKDDLISFSILPNTKVHGIVSYRGVIKGGYFFEANILINILDSDKKILKASNAMATSDWMTSEPVGFEGNIDFTGLPKGSAYFEIRNDNPSDLREYDKNILIPIIIESSNTEDEIMAKEIDWSKGGGNGFPKGWIDWQDKINGIEIIKWGPVKLGDSYIVHIPASLVSTMPYQHCVGDSESATCFVGENSEVLRWFKVYSYFY